MIPSTLHPTIIAATLLAGAVLTAGAPVVAAARERPPGEGVLCLWGIATAAAEVGKHCPVTADPAYQAALEESVAAMDRYIAVNGGWDDAQIAAFKRNHARVGANPEILCAPVMVRVWDKFRTRGAELLRKEVGKLLEQPGKPTFGDCL